MESLLPKNDQVCSTVTPDKKQRTITNITDRNKQKSFTKLMDTAYDIALKPNLPLAAFNFAIKALKKFHVNIINGCMFLSCHVRVSE